MNRWKKWLKRMNCLGLCICILAIQWLTPLQVYGEENTNRDFYQFIAEYLDQNYVFETENAIVENLEQEMSHHILYKAMEQQGWLMDRAVTLQHISDEWGYAFSGESELYEQVLLEIIRNYVNSELFEQKIKEEQEHIEYQILDIMDTD